MSKITDLFRRWLKLDESLDFADENEDIGEEKQVHISAADFARWDAAHHFLKMKMYEEAGLIFDRMIALDPMDEDALWGKLRALTGEMHLFEVPEETLQKIRELQSDYLAACDGKKNSCYMDLQEYLRVIQTLDAEKKQQLILKRNELEEKTFRYKEMDLDYLQLQEDIENNEADMQDSKMSASDVFILIGAMTCTAYIIYVIIKGFPLLPTIGTALYFALVVWGMWFFFKGRIEHIGAKKESVALAKDAVRCTNALREKEKEIAEIKAEIERMLEEE